MNKKYKLKEQEHIFNELLNIINTHLKNDDLYLLFSTASGLIKGKWYPYNSFVNPESEIWAHDFKENQELLIDKCLYEAVAEKIFAEKNKSYGELTLPDITYKDVLCLKEVTIYSDNREVKLPSFLLFTPNIIGFSLVDKTFKP